MLPAPIGQLICTVVHSHNQLLVIDAGQHENDWGVGDDEIQVVLGEVSIYGLKAFMSTDEHKTEEYLPYEFHNLFKSHTYDVKEALAGIYCVEQLINMILQTKHV